MSLSEFGRLKGFIADAEFVFAMDHPRLRCSGGSNCSREVLWRVVQSAGYNGRAADAVPPTCHHHATKARQAIPHPDALGAEQDVGK